MWRKLILLAVTSAIAKRLYDHRRPDRQHTPFPTSGRPPQGRMRRARRASS